MIAAEASSPQHLGWKSIPAVRWSSLSWDEIRELELIENLDRLDLTTYDQSREMLEHAKVEVLRTQAARIRDTLMPWPAATQ